jgi:hypothetical protein
MLLPERANLQARKLAEEAAAIDPGYQNAYCLIGITHSYGRVSRHIQIHLKSHLKRLSTIFKRCSGR